MMPLHYVRYVTIAMFATSRIFAMICPHVLLWAALARPLADRYNAPAWLDRCTASIRGGKEKMLCQDAMLICHDNMIC